MKAIDRYIIKQKIKWLNEDLRSSHSYYSKDKIRKWIKELKEKLKKSNP